MLVVRDGEMFKADMIANDTHTVLMQTVQQLSDYFAGKLTSFSLPLNADGLYKKTYLLDLERA